MTEQPVAPQRPLPTPTAADAPFWAGCREHRLMLTRCRDCGLVWFPAYEHCAGCTSAELEWIEASGRGVIWGWIEMHQRYIPYFADQVPYNVVLVKLEEGALLYSNMVGARFEDLRADMPVEVVFEDVDDSFSLPKFRLVAS